MLPAAPADRFPAGRPRSRRSFLLLLLPGLLVGAAIALFCLRAWVYGYLRSDDFRRFLDRKASVALRADGRFQPLHWQGAEVHSDAFDAAGGLNSPFSKLTVEQTRARLDLSALWHKVWRVESIDAEKFAATLSSPLAALSPDSADAAQVKPSEGEGNNFLAGWLPNRVEINEVRANDFSLGWDGGRVTGARLTARPRNGGDGDGSSQDWEIDGSGGRLEAAGVPAVRLAKFNVKSSAREVFLTRAEGQLENGGRIDFSGRQALDADRALDLTANFDGLPIGEFLPPDWRTRLHGNATGTVRVTGSADDPAGRHARGHVELRDGQMEALPVLDELAVFTATERYRQTALQKGRADFDWTPQRITVSNLLVESEGLLRVEGGFTVRGEQIDGTLQVGVARSSLRWVAAVGAQVFDLPERDGYVWTTVHLHGPARHPAEDLTPRLITAARNEVIDKAKKGAGTVLDTASDLLDLLKPQ